MQPLAMRTDKYCREEKANMQKQQKKLAILELKNFELA
jgi:hypothetical protein